MKVSAFSLLLFFVSSIHFSDDTYKSHGAIKVILASCVLDGKSSKTPVTFTLSLLSILNTLLIGSSLPKYFFAVSSVITIELGADNAVAGLPSLYLNWNISKKFEKLIAEKQQQDNRQFSQKKKNLGQKFGR